MREEKIIAISGGFDPIHIGHLQLFRDASEYGKVCVVLNSDSWIVNKKGFFFMPWEERSLIITSIPWVSKIIKAKDRDGTVCDTLREIRPDYFGNGGPRRLSNMPLKEISLCEELNIPMIWNLGENSMQTPHMLALQDQSIKRMVKLIQNNERFEKGDM